MKKIIHYITYVVIIAVILPSCMNKLSVTKRRYNKGYYVQHSNKRHTEPEKNKDINDKLVVTDTKTTGSEPVLKQDQLLAQAAINEASEMAKTQEKAPSSKPNSLKQKTLNAFASNPDLLPSDRIIKAMESKSLTKSGDAASDVLSLFWIIILIILLLYLFGLLFDGFGLGWAIHILALIVLILLILWLLRVV